MPIETNLHRPVSNRGQWRDAYLIVAPGAIDPEAVFTIRVYAQDGRPGRLDYGFRADCADGCAPIQATTDDETGRFTVSVTDRGLACDWLFPKLEMSRLCAGSYQASISVVIGDEDAELVRLNFVVR